MDHACTSKHEPCELGAQPILLARRCRVLFKGARGKTPEGGGKDLPSASYARNAAPEFKGGAAGLRR